MYLLCITHSFFQNLVQKLYCQNVRMVGLCDKDVKLT